MFNVPLFRNKKQQNNVLEIIKKIKAGDKLLRENFIHEYKPFILKTVSRSTGKYIEVENSEEFSVGLLAFNEAIDCYDYKKNPNFFKFTEHVIKRRIIDYFRSSSQTAKIYPFTYFEDEEHCNFEEKYLKVESAAFFESIETREEIELFENKLNEFGITFEDLVMHSPKHNDSKLLSIKIARVIADNAELYQRLDKNKNIPMTELIKKVEINPRTIERNRKFIIAVSLILRSNLDVLKGYIRNTEEGGESKC